MRGELAMRELPPEPSSDEPPKQLEQKDPGQPIDPVGDERSPTETLAREVEPSAIEVRPDAPREPVALAGDELSLPGGLLVRDVPKGSQVFARTGLDVWEVVDKRGRLLLRVRATPLRTAARPADAPLVGSARFAETSEVRSDWDAKPVRVAITRLASDTHLYTLERRAAGTDWAFKGLEIDVARK